MAVTTMAVAIVTEEIWRTIPVVVIHVSSLALVFSTFNNHFCSNFILTYAAYIRAPDKSAYWKTIFFISYPKHMLWVLKRTVSMRRFF